MAKEIKVSVRVMSMSIVDRPAIASTPGQEPAPQSPLYQVNFQELGGADGIARTNLTLILPDLGSLKPGHEGELIFVPTPVA